jgi:hypothetical protein
MLNFYPPFLCRVLAAILKILKTQNCSSNGDLSLCQILSIIISYYYYSSYSSFFPCTMNLSMANLRNYRTEFHETWWSYRYMFLVPLMVTYHYVKFYVAIIIQLEAININVQNFKFPIGFYSNPHPLWTPKNMALTPFTTNLKHKNGG